MRSEKSVVVAIIPALNEEESIGKVLADLPETITQVIVCDNGSTDRTAEIAERGGAIVVHESDKGYGAACLRAVAEVPKLSVAVDILLFVDADYSDYPQEAELLLKPIKDDNADMVIGSRMLTIKDHNALPSVAAFGNWLTSGLIRLIWSEKFTDIGPFRAIRYEAYKKLNMQDRNFGWTVEMQVRAVKLGFRCFEVPVSYRPRLGESKISGTVIGSVRAGVKFLWIVAREALLK